jgi:DNA-binding GntR family transcriptional regulator
MKKYQIVRQYLLEKIKNLYPDDQIPSEREIVNLLQVSRMTVRKAIIELVEEGYLYRDNNLGTFVAKTTMKRYYDQLLRARLTNSETFQRRDVHRVRLIKATDEVASKLGVEVDVMVLQYQATTYEEDRPIGYEEAYYNADLLGDIDYELFRLLGLRYIKEKLNLEITTAIKRFQAVLPVPIVQHHLQLPPNQPIIYQTSQQFLKDGRIIQYYKSYLNDQYTPVILMTRV